MKLRKNDLLKYSICVTLQLHQRLLMYIMGDLIVRHASILKTYQYSMTICAITALKYTGQHLWVEG